MAKRLVVAEFQHARCVGRMGGGGIKGLEKTGRWREEKGRGIKNGGLRGVCVGIGAASP